MSDCIAISHELANLRGQAYMNELTQKNKILAERILAQFKTNKAIIFAYKVSPEYVPKNSIVLDRYSDEIRTLINNIVKYLYLSRQNCVVCCYVKYLPQQQPMGYLFISQHLLIKETTYNNTIAKRKLYNN